MTATVSEASAQTTDAEVIISIDSDVSIVFDQAENRLHSQKALLAMLSA